MAEVAGLVLGIIPLTISALEHYQTMCDAFYIMRNHTETFREFHLRLQAAIAIYRYSVVKILSPLSLEEEQLEKRGSLDSENILTLWDVPDYSRMLDEKLGKEQRDTYRGLFRIFFGKIKRLVVDLKLNKQCQPLWLRKDGSVDVFRQTRFIACRWSAIRAGLKSKSFHQQIEAIEKDVERIRALIDSQLKAAPHQALRERAITSGKRKRESRYLGSITEAARKFHALLSSWPLSCPIPCGYAHKASLQISEYSPGFLEVDNEMIGRDGDECKIHLSTLFLLDEVGKQPTWNWRAVKVEPRLEQGCAPDVNNVTVSVGVSSNNDVGFGSSISRNKVAPGAGGRQRVQFATTSDRAESVLVAQRCISGQNNANHSIAFSRIENLCKSLQNATTNVGGFNLSSHDSCIGFLEGPNSVHYFYTTKVPKCCESRTSGYIVSLRDIILRRGQWKFPLKSLEKSSIAYCIANAVLQFHDTPWLQHSWTTEDVQFILDGSPSFSLAQPVISKEFGKGKLLEGEAFSPTSICVKNQAVFSLGLALLELTFDMTIEEARDPKDIEETGGIVTVLTDFVTAKRLLATVGVRETENLFTAIHNCIEITSLMKTAPKRYSLEEDDFRTAFLEGVVLPLRADYELIKRSISDRKVYFS